MKDMDFAAKERMHARLGRLDEELGQLLDDFDKAGGNIQPYVDIYCDMDALDENAYKNLIAEVKKAFNIYNEARRY